MIGAKNDPQPSNSNMRRSIRRRLYLPNPGAFRMKKLLAVLFLSPSIAMASPVTGEMIDVCAHSAKLGFFISEMRDMGAPISDALDAVSKNKARDKPAVYQAKIGIVKYSYNNPGMNPEVVAANLYAGCLDVAL